MTSLKRFHEILRSGVFTGRKPRSGLFQILFNFIKIKPLFAHRFKALAYLDVRCPFCHFITVKDLQNNLPDLFPLQVFLPGLLVLGVLQDTNDLINVHLENIERLSAVGQDWYGEDQQCKNRGAQRNVLLNKNYIKSKGKPQVIVGRKTTGLKKIFKIAGLPI